MSNRRSASFSLRGLLVAGAAALSFLVPTVALAQEAAPSASVGTYAVQGQGPGLWVVRDEDSTLYLFGTFHALKPDTAWRTASMDAAFASADEYWFELANITDTSAVVPIVQQKGLSPTRPLSSLLSSEEMASLDRAAKSVGLTAAQLDPMRPWFAGLSLGVATITQAGYRPEHGGDTILHTMAEARGKPIKGFETMAQQVGFFADLDEDKQVEQLRSSLKEFDAGPEQLHKMVTAWSTGDVQALDDMIGATTRVQAPETYDIIFTKRNKDWAEQVAKILEGSGTVFIAVGAGHLAGPDSLQAQLEARGIHAERLTQ